MPVKLVHLIRNSAAILITLSGIGQIAALWFRDLSGAALTDALLGTVYLIVGIGLFGRSRFSLFMAMVIPAAAAVYVLNAFPDAGTVYNARVTADAVVIACSAIVLWNVRKDPSV